MSTFKIKTDSNGVPTSDPISLENLEKIYKKSIPSEYVDFIDSPLPTVNVYEVVDGYQYVRKDNYYVREYIVRPMSSAEILSKQNEVKHSWNEVGYPSWTFNEEKCCFEPPQVNPATLRYEWNEETQQWVQV